MVAVIIIRGFLDTALSKIQRLYRRLLARRPNSSLLLLSAYAHDELRSRLELRAEGLLLYYITDRTQFPGDETARRRALFAKIADAARCGVDYIQLREKDLSARALETLAGEAVRLVRDPRMTSDQPAKTRLLINSRTDVALAVGADGVHLRSDDVSASTVRSIWSEALARSSQPVARSPFIAVSCHTPADVAHAAADGADFATFAAVFGKHNQPGVRPTGLDLLLNASSATIPVLALGGVTLENAASCLQAGAAGVAGIRLFQENKIEDVVRALRPL